MRNLLKILTPENVYIEYELAGIGSRFAAMLIDLIIIVLSLCILSIPADLISKAGGGMANGIFQEVASLFMAILIIATFLIYIGYFTVLEFLLNGQTFGKRVMKLRTMKETGEPVGLYESFIRNIVKLMMLMPIVNIMDFIVILNSRKYKRLGDIAANTIVVKERTLKNYALDINKLERIAEGVRKNTSGFTVDNQEYGILREIFERKDLGVNKLNVAAIMREHFKMKFNVEIKEEDTFKFLSEIYKVGSKQ